MESLSSVRTGMAGHNIYLTVLTEMGVSTHTFFGAQILAVFTAYSLCVATATPTSCLKRRLAILGVRRVLIKAAC